MLDETIIAVQDPLRLGDDSEPQPDLMPLRPRADWYADAHPEASDTLLVVEVADSTLRHDRDRKLPLYARHGVPEVWLIDLHGARLTIHRDPESTGYRENHEVTGPLDALAPRSHPHWRIDLSDLFDVPRT